jgi:hypothetical protein
LKKGQQYGKRPVRVAGATPWEIVQVDLIGPWKFKAPSGVKTLRCFPAIDPATSWPEICEIIGKRSQTVMDAFQNKWLCRYRRFIQVNFGNGSEFKSFFKKMCDN